MNKTIVVCAGVIRNKGKCLVCTRPPGSKNENMWEFPGGKRHAKESDQECLKRELREELGIEVFVLDMIFQTKITAKDTNLELRFYRAFISEQSPDIHPKEGQKFLWISSMEAQDMEFLPGDRPMLEFLQKTF